MPNRPRKTPSTGIRTGGSIGIGGYGLGDMASPEMNPYLNADQETANVEASAKAGKPVNVDTKRLYSKPTFMQKLFNPTAASEAERANLDWYQTQMLSKQAFGNQMEMQKLQDAEAYRRAMDLAKFGADMDMSKMREQEQLRRDANIDAQLAGEVERDISNRRAFDQSRMINAESDTRKADLDEAKIVRDLIRRGKAAKFGAPEFYGDRQIDDEIAAEALRVAQGQRGAEIGAAAYPTWLKAQNATNEATAKYADPEAAKRTYVPVSKGTAQFSLAHGVPPLFGESEEDDIRINPYTNMPQKVGTKQIPASIGKSADEIATGIQARLAKLRAAQTAELEDIQNKAQTGATSKMGNRAVMDAESMPNTTQYVHPIPDIWEVLSKGRYSMPIRKASPYGF